ncbi:neurogenic locus notch homolog protein 1-like [Schistocerca cancellata]|uniref:neurogenic locus notch homolog protein 1-like n=1 Tax=Schistocerca cancellata TaxID=274614 RepID=UPI002117FF31|nr:neurogenic locus notch homolog protein 1-like [Schistocerca cancellata]
MMYFCKCVEGFTGIACEYSDQLLSTVSDCPPHMSREYCLNNGTCYKDIISDVSGYYCVCPYPFHGERCELTFPTESHCPDFIQKQLCSQHATCIEITLNDFVIYYCECLEGFYGLRCEHTSITTADIGEMVCPPPLDSILCLNGGTCIQIITKQLHKLHFCECVVGFYGLSCEYPYPPVPRLKCPSVIADTRCLNGGTCFMMIVSSVPAYYCVCPSQYHGDKCESKSARKFDIQDSSGTQCPNNIAKSYCQNGGTCYMEFSTVGEPVYYCACSSPYYGERCEEKVHRRSLHLPAEINGTRSPLKAAIKCQNGGTCVTNVTSGETIPYCICAAPFYGEECEFSALISNYRSKRSSKLPCPPEKDDYCLNGGTCYMTETQEIFCDCPPHLTGYRCEFNFRIRGGRLPCPEDLDVNFCQNGGTCYMERGIGSPRVHCICTPHYSGKRCEQNVYYHSHSGQCSAENANKLCQNGGTCLAYTFTGDTIYYCHCPYPFYGKTCELKYPEPFSCPTELQASLCLNGGLCIEAKSNGHYIYWCKCPENYYGARCEHIQRRQLFCPPPFNTVLCKNGGSCINAIDSEGQQIFFCQCAKAFTGPSCEYSLPYVPTLPDVCPPAMKATFCLHGGKCQVHRFMDSLTYFCRCPYPYHGERCEHMFSAVSPCSQSVGSCLCCNGGECSKINLDKCDIYYCGCAEGYYGARCEHAHETQQECPRPFSTELCKNAGTCVSIMTSGKQNLYFCKCVEGFYGMSCEYPYPALQLSCVQCPPYVTRSLCLNGGKCCMDIVVGEPIYYCVCPEPYYGDMCDLKHSRELSCSLPFRLFLCLNGGSCVQGKSNGYNIQWCECTRGYYGARCEHVQNHTASNILKCPPDLETDLCKNGGTCVGIVSPADRDLFFCECPERFYGLYCENLHTPIPSAVVCPHEEIAPYCLHGGTCLFDAFQLLYYCTCAYPFAGERCEYMHPVQSSCPQSLAKYLCLNGGTCIHIRLTHYGIYVCKCTEGFYGSKCEYNSEDAGIHTFKCPHPLDSELCKNGGTCYGVAQSINHQELYFCKCLENFYGLSCEHQHVHEANKGKECPPGIERHFCENGGTCYAVNIEGIHVYYCECLDPYFGGRCELINTKPQSCPWILDQFLCLNGGICSSLLQKTHQCDIYYCECKEGYGGHRCENKIFPEIETEYCSQPGSDWFCLGNGICFQEVINGQNIYHCDCKTDFAGERCQLYVKGKSKPCSYGYNEVFCLHGGTCFQTSVDKVTMFYCECQDGFIGERCEYKQPRIRDCCPVSIDRILCLNGGTCYKENIQHQDYYMCACQGHYFGPRCEYKPVSTETCQSDLAENFCLNGGTCYSFLFESVTVYYCQCTDGHYGGRCEHAVNNTLVEGLCSADMADWFCANGGTCFNILVLNEPFYYCECPNQYTGARCESKLSTEAVTCSVNISEVFCRLGSECYDMVIGDTMFHYCDCAEGYRGMRCQYEKYKHNCPTILATEFCLNGATCHVLFFKGHVVYYCECTTEYYGLRCETKFPYSEGIAYPCEETFGAHYCLNGGTCYEIDHPDEKVTFCECPEGYNGLRCEFSDYEPVDKPECPPPLHDTFCKNGGTCYLAPFNTTGSPYICKCREGYQGAQCEFHAGEEVTGNCYPPHNESFCLNGGTCYQEEPGPDADRVCYCPANYYGPRCESSTTLLAFQCPLAIASNFCYNGGTCYQADHGPDTIYFCHCPEDYRGLRCEYGPDTSVNQTKLCPPPLNEGYCQNGGTCYQMDNGTNTFYFCECASGFTGPRCEHWSRNVEQCDFPLDSTFCFNAGTCNRVKIPESAVYYCECPSDFYGLRCEIRMPCAGSVIRRCDREKEKDFCLNNGLCYESECGDNTVRACTCPKGYTGVRCEFPPARRLGCPYPLDSYFCQNGGTCATILFEGHALFGCHCPQGYSGEKCELDMSSKHEFCPIQFGEIFCLNGGICYETSLMNEVVYYCECPDGYWGERCEFSGVLKFPCPKSLGNVFCLNGGTGSNQVQEQEFTTENLNNMPAIDVTISVPVNAEPDPIIVILQKLDAMASNISMLNQRQEGFNDSAMSPDATDGLS